ncbi:MAG: glycoside hydrolase family 35 protein, partial [Candidatus Angelobacter sp.]
MVNFNGSHRLDILAENSGRVNFSTAIRGERAGIVGPVTYGGTHLTGWTIYPLPLATPPAAGYSETGCVGLCFFHAAFSVASPGDTYLNTEQLGKGVLWVNGHLLGRFWNIGPAGSLYLPGVWLHKGRNEITIFDLNGGSDLTVQG